MSFRPLENLNDRVAVITGGMGQVGKVTATRLAARGARVILLVRRDLAEAQAWLDQQPQKQRHFALPASVTDSETLRAAAREVEARAGRCDILINAAGITRSIRPNDLEALSDEIFDQIVAVNLRGVYACIRAFAPLLIRSGDGLVINISSTAALRASESNVAYAAAKAGVDVMTKTLARALAPNVRVVGVRPGYLVLPTSGATKSPDFNSRMAANSPLKRIGEADDIASAIEAFALSLRFATGTTMTIDGGRTI
jgi:3-oxoacyl-[acyl-carrier protein] reductase